MDWTVGTPGSWAAGSLWLTPFVQGGRHRFKVVSHPRSVVSWHDRKRPTTGTSEWLATWNYSAELWRQRRDGIITLFPPAAAAIGLRKRLTRSPVPIVACDFNLGQIYGGAKRVIARVSLARINRFIVHARRESHRYAAWLSLPIDRFRFVPMQCGAIPTTHDEDTERPFLLAMGSAHRDYKTFFEAVGRLGLSTVVVAAAHALQGLKIPGNVEVYSGLTLQQCRELAQQARLSIVPVANDETASGQITVVEAMRMGRPVIATRCIGTEDYINSGSNGVLVPLGSADALAEAIAQLWDDDAYRLRLAETAREHAEDHFSDEAAGEALRCVLDEFEGTGPDGPP